MKILSKTLLGLIILFSVIACATKEEKVPDYLWEEERFVEVLTEFQKVESLVRLSYHRFPDSVYSNDSVYQAFFDKMGITEEDLDSNYRYYIKDPENMEKIYDKMITTLSQEAAELEKKKDQ